MSLDDGDPRPTRPTPSPPPGYPGSGGNWQQGNQYPNINDFPDPNNGGYLAGDRGYQIIPDQDYETQKDIFNRSSQNPGLFIDNRGNWAVNPGGTPKGFSPTAGIDRRYWDRINNPNAFEYGAKPGLAASEEQRYAQMGQQYAQRSAPQMSLGEYDFARNQAIATGQQQLQALGMARTSAMGGGPSAAGVQQNAGLAQAMRDQLRQMNSGRPGSGTNGAFMNQAGSQAVMNAAQARSAEQMAARNIYAAQAGGIRGADLSGAGISQQMAFQQANLQAGQNQLNQQGQLAAEAMRQSVFEQQMAAQQQGEFQNQSVGLAQSNLQMQRDMANAAYNRQLVGGLIGTAGQLAGYGLMQQANRKE